MFTVTGTNGHRFRIVMVTSYMALSSGSPLLLVNNSLAAHTASLSCTSVKLKKAIYFAKGNKKLNGRINVILGRTE